MNISNKQLVYEIVSKIPKGKVTTYGAIARRLGWKSARPVGSYLHVNEDAAKVPCHRVVMSSGKIASGYAMGGPVAQVKKLKEEGVRFNGERVDLTCVVSSPS